MTRSLDRMTACSIVVMFMLGIGGCRAEPPATPDGRISQVLESRVDAYGDLMAIAVRRKVTDKELASAGVAIDSRNVREALDDLTKIFASDWSRHDTRAIADLVRIDKAEPILARVLARLGVDNITDESAFSDLYTLELERRENVWVTTAVAVSNPPSSDSSGPPASELNLEPAESIPNK